MIFPDYNRRLAHKLLGNRPVALTTSQQRQVSVRQGLAADSEMLAQMYRRLSERSIRLRYGAPQQRFSEDRLGTELARILAADQLATTLIGTVAEGGASSAVAIAELVQSPSDHTVAEIGLLVRDDYQREGLGRTLSRMLHQVALARGVRLLRIYMLAENIAIMNLIRSLGVRYSAETRRGETTVLIPVGGS